MREVSRFSFGNRVNADPYARLDEKPPHGSDRFHA